MRRRGARSGGSRRCAGSALPLLGERWAHAHNKGKRGRRRSACVHSASLSLSAKGRAVERRLVGKRRSCGRGAEGGLVRLECGAVPRRWREMLRRGRGAFDDQVETVERRKTTQLLLF